GYPAAEFVDAWDKVLLYSEHTWGAHSSVWGPERQETREQWAIKRGYALDADARTHALLGKALAGGSDPRGADPNAAVDIYNTTSWPRTDLVVLPRASSAAGDRVTEEGGRPVPSQRLASGELAFIARDVPPFAARRYRISTGAAHAEGPPAFARGAEVGNGLLRVRVDEKTGAIADLRAQGIEGNFVDRSSGRGVNEYLYLIGDDLSDVQGASEVRISVREPGPLVASLAVESEAPGCNRLVREVRVIAGLDRVELANAVDKKRHGGDSPPDRFYKRPEGKESVNFAFPFAVAGGVMRLDLPYAVIVPWEDLMPSACKNWFTAGRWADVSAAGRGITWATLDAPLVEVGGITATLLESQSDPDVWRKEVEPTQTLYSWAMNNHWGTNYRAYQEGLVVFRYALRPHRGYDPIEATRFGTALSQPLVATPASGAAPSTAPRLRVEPEDVIATALKPTDDGTGWIIRLFGASGEARRARLIWSDPAPRRIARTDLGEAPGEPIPGEIDVPAWGLVTIRADR
ncbi:MAG: hypothetical protein JXP34_08180, partial [Planctomycetes bacterium]|nr:hypothetical protein [Planctomycetota bacterium]